VSRLLTLLTCVGALSIGGCNQQVAILETPVTPSPTAAPIPVPTQPQIAGITISPPAVNGGDSATGIVTLAGVAQLFPVIVSLSSNNGAAIVSSEAVVPAGSTFGRFGVRTERFPNDRTVVISASTPERTVTTNFGVWTIEAPVFFNYYSDESDFVGGGGFGRFVPGTSTISAVCDRNEVRVRITAPGSQVWSATFRGSVDEPLWAGAAYDVFSAGEKDYGPDLAISSQGRVCSTTDGRFFVEEIDLRNNRVNLFRATFEQRCNGGDAALYGEVRVENMPSSSSVVNCFR
jgi:hypothetical protein